MIDAEERAAKQRSFYLKLSPQLGQTIATSIGGFLPPGEDSQESEVRDTMSLWLKMHFSGALATVADSSWWMTRFMDRQGRLTRAESENRADELASFAVATVGMLLDSGILQFTKEPETPKLVTSTYDPINDDIHQAILDRMEAGMDTLHDGEDR